MFLQDLSLLGYVNNGEKMLVLPPGAALAGSRLCAWTALGWDVKRMFPLWLRG